MFVCYRFWSSAEDPRPISWPLPKGSAYWISGEDYETGHAILLAWLPKEKELLELWPEAYNIEKTASAEVAQFSSRFTQPSYWQPPEGWTPPVLQEAKKPFPFFGRGRDDFEEENEPLESSQEKGEDEC